MTNITKHKIAIFDLDETLLAGDSSCLWTNYLWEKKRVTDPAFLALDKQMIADYYAERLNINQYLHQHLSYFNQYGIEEINQWVTDFTHTIIKPLLYPQGINTINLYRQQNIPVIIISATMSFLVHAIAKQLNADISMGIDMQIKIIIIQAILRVFLPLERVKSLDSISGKNKTTLRILIFISILTQPTISLYAIKQMRLSPLTPMKD